MKKIKGSLVSLIIMCCLTLSAGAIDYVQNPGYDLSNPLLSGVYSNLVETEAVINSVTEGKSIDIDKGGAKVTASSLSQIVEEMKKIGTSEKIVFKSDFLGYELTIDVNSITGFRNISTFLNVKKSDVVTKTKAGDLIPKGVVRVEPAMKGDFGMTFHVKLKPDLTADFRHTYGKNLVGVNLYYVSDEGKTTKLPAGSAVLNDDGSVEIDINSASYYYLKPIVKKDDSNTGSNTPAKTPTKNVKTITNDDINNNDIFDILSDFSDESVVSDLDTILDDFFPETPSSIGSSYLEFDVLEDISENLSEPEKAVISNNAVNNTANSKTHNSVNNISSDNNVTNINDTNETVNIVTEPIETFEAVESNEWWDSDKNPSTNTVVGVAGISVVIVSVAVMVILKRLRG